MQLVLLASFAVIMVSVSPPLTGAMDALVDVVMAVMREDAVSICPCILHMSTYQSNCLSPYTSVAIN